MDDSFNCFHLPTVIADIGSRLQLDAQRIQAAVELLDAGNTIPFIARYRKEATKSLDEVALRQVEDWLHFHQELAQRKNTILKTIDQQQQLTPELRQQIEQCWDKNALEEIYLPYKPKRRTRATIARERGLQPLADILLAQKPIEQSRQRLLQQFVDPAKDVADPQAALAGACDIVAEVWSEDAAMRQWMFEESQHAMIRSQVKRGKKSDDSKFEMYFDHQEALKKIPSHRFLAMKRAEAEGVVNLSLLFDEDAVLRKLQRVWVTNPSFEFAAELRDTVEDCFRRLLLPSIETSVLSQLKEAADAEAIEVFAKNLRELLLAAPAGPKVTMGIDPGFRTGCKVAVVDGTGKFLTNTTIYPTPPKSDIDGAEQTLLGLIQQYQIELIAIGNGTASRETDQFVSKLIKQHRLPVTKVMVNESGASIYSASELAVSEYPQLDVTVRGAISIAHRLQDPLAELVKIDAKSIGVGQYQHDVNQTALKKSLDREVESCVNSVGVDLNMASSALLSYVAGIGPKLAANIVKFRDENGRFQDRSQINKVPKLGNKAFVQAAGFLRIRDGRNPLDNSAVHPESYYVVEKWPSR
ncbi:MAG: Tex family protein [Pirellulaceae bacterium]